MITSVSEAPVKRSVTIDQPPAASVAALAKLANRFIRGQVDTITALAWLVGRKHRQSETGVNQPW